MAGFTGAKIVGYNLGGNYLAQGVLSLNRNQYDTKVNYNLSQKLAVWGKYSRMDAPVKGLYPFGDLGGSALGTAGFTAALVIHKMEHNGQEPGKGPVVVHLLGRQLALPSIRRLLGAIVFGKTCSSMPSEPYRKT